MKLTPHLIVLIGSFLLTLALAVGGSFLLSQSRAQYYLLGAQLVMGEGGETPQAPVDAATVEENRSFLFLGADESGDLIDSIMVVRIENRFKEIQIVSLPRDFLIFDANGNYAKINSVYARAKRRGDSEDEALRLLAQYVSRITGIEIDNHIKIDFEGFEKLVDHIGGVTVDVKESIDDPFFPGPNYSYDRFTIEAGVQVVDGPTALRYARSRYVSAGGDLDRARRQQQVVEGIKEKLARTNPLRQVTLIPGVIRIIGEYSTTDLSLAGLRDIYATYQTIDTYQVYNLVVGQDLLRGPIKENYRMFGRSRGFVLEPRAGAQNYTQIHEEVTNMYRREEYLQEIRDIREERARIGVILDGEPSQLSQDIVNLFRTHGLQVSVIGPRPEMRFETSGIYVSNPTRMSEIETTYHYMKNYLEAVELDADPERLEAAHIDMGYDILVYIQS